MPVPLALAVPPSASAESKLQWRPSSPDREASLALDRRKLPAFQAARLGDATPTLSDGALAPATALENGVGPVDNVIAFTTQGADALA